MQRFMLVFIAGGGTTITHEDEAGFATQRFIYTEYGRIYKLIFWFMLVLLLPVFVHKSHMMIARL